MTTVALFGNPNTGKTTLFNELTDKYAYVGNWTGVTVEKKIGKLRHSKTTVVDLPGIYSLNPITKDEGVAVEYLLNHKPSLILNVTNASQLKRNLLLTIELLESGIPVVIALNMIDDLKKTGSGYHLTTLSDRLHCQLTTTNARNKKGIGQLREEVLTTISGSSQFQTLKLNYSNQVEEGIFQAVSQLTTKFQMTADFSRWITIQFMNKNEPIRQYAAKNKLKPLIDQEEFYDQQKFESQIFATRMTFIEETLRSARFQTKFKSSNQLTNQIDRIVTHPFLGLPIFAGIFYLMFKLSFDWLGTPLSETLNIFLSGPVSNFASHFLMTIGAIPFLRSLIVNGIIAGVGGVLTFIPQIFVLFACISILEDSGYMARAALVTDRIMQLIGLNGKSFIPLIIGFGCNVTGIMAARTIEQPKERLVTTLISPFMSCSARLPIYSLFVSAFFNKNQALIVLSLYFLGIIIALIMAKIYQMTFKIKGDSDFIIELPEYHLPKLDIIAKGTWDKGKGFIRKAGTVIFAGTVLIWLISNLNFQGPTPMINHSWAAYLGKALLPLFIPIGVTSWEIVSALLTGIVAKEVISSSMIVLFHLSASTDLIATFSSLLTPLSAYSLLVFILLYIPCFSTLASIKIETGSIKWSFYSAISSFAIAYTIAFLIYQVGSLFM
ncbi:MAG: ferrous iron transport protein B [Lentilactobacillus diolivorans]|jgi:ferrous iron transport protein B|uniref:ferrous iron transport protein B n=1 Tax=Lentilactobacillus diolivorans TaxID=179838 RepID=UPI000FF3E523|nr:ferrous iron transport protein B [Lentilactobacillus diolivorans]MCH4164235.1 ferrous iron transport protein B [Lentilactobacillus diolivorans]MDH5104615.1 ferrous iron transport protein B [Lentilactobacillus diolivorans]RRG04413.1 MAG: ferrous iron transport protein B [Lactobacillus sp.]